MASSTIKAALTLVYDVQKEISLHEQLLSLLHWDQQTIMPEAAIHERADQIGYVSKRAHELLTSKKLSSAVALLAKPTSQTSLSPLENIMIKKLHKKIKKASKVSASFVEELSRLRVESQQAWEQA